MVSCDKFLNHPIQSSILCQSRRGAGKGTRAKIIGMGVVLLQFPYNGFWDGKRTSKIGGRADPLYNVLFDVGNIPEPFPVPAGVIGADNQAEIHQLGAVIVRDFPAGHAYNNVGGAGHVSININIAADRYRQILLEDVQGLHPLLSVELFSLEQLFQHFNQRIMAELGSPADAGLLYLGCIVFHL